MAADNWRGLVPRPHIPRPIDPGDEWVVTFPNIGVLRASLDGRRSTWVSDVGADAALVRKVTHGCVRAFLARLAGQTTFHAGAVSVGDRAVLLLGDSGAGKSTTVAALCARGAHLLADDYAVLSRDGDERLVEPSEDTHWLDANAHALVESSHALTPVVSGKGPIPGAMGERAKLTAFIELSFGEGPVKLERMTGVAAFQVLLPHLLRFVNDEPDVQLWETERLIELADVPCYIMRRPRGRASLDESTAAIFQLLEAPR